VFLVVLSQRGYLDPLQDVVLRLFSPVTSVVNAVGETLSGNSGPPQSELERELEELRAEVALLRERAAQAAELEETLGFTTANPQYQTLGARVIEQQTGNFEAKFAIDRGSDDDIAEGMVVLAPGGTLVGRIVRVFPSYSWVLLVTDEASRVGVSIPTANVTATGASNGDGRLALEFVPKDVQVNVGDEVLTTALSGRFPEGLLVGTVDEVSDAEELFQTVLVRPSAPIERLDLVVVITNFTPEPIEGPPE
jgi:rod shape-determining protein MreC